MTVGRKIAATILPCLRPNEMKRSRLAIAAFAALLAFVLAGCGGQDDQALQSENADLRAMLANNQQQMAAMQQQMAELNDKLTEMQHNNASPNDEAALKQQIAALQKQVQAENSNAAAVPPGVVPNGAPGAQPNGTPPPGDNGNDTVAGNPPPAPPGYPPTIGASPAASPGANADEDDDNGDDTDQQTASNPPPSAPAPIPSGTSWQSQIDPQLASAASSGDPAAKPYSAGLIALKGGMYQQALGKFNDLQHRYPKSPLSEPAEYFSANALYEMGKYEQAILQFNDVTMRFPNGKFASASLLREAQAFQKINDPIDARLTLQKLVNDHPDSPEAAEAKSMMQGMANG
jgi:tol-pal system protein YbgF